MRTEWRPVLLYALATLGSLGCMVMLWYHPNPPSRTVAFLFGACAGFVAVVNAMQLVRSVREMHK